MAGLLCAGLALALLLSAAHAFSAPPSVDCQSAPQSGYPFCDTTLSFEERTNDLIGRLTLAELINQTSSIAPAIPRLGINAYNWRSNCLHGWTNGPDNWPPNTYWTVFPNPTGMAAAFNDDVLLRAGQITSDEGRALHNINLAYYNGSSAEASGLNCFSPNVNLYRHPLWGRNQETFGEDTYHMSRSGLGYTIGLQKGTESSPYLKVGACTKHFAAHDGPDDTREYFTANVTTFDFFDTYLPSTEAQVLAGNVAQLMPAYSAFYSPESTDGAPNCANTYLLVDILRERLNTPNISVCSDNGGIAMVYQTHHYTDSMLMAAVVSMNATTDIDLGYDLVYTTYLPQAVEQGLVSAASITAAVWRSMLLRMRLGDFDPVDMVPFQSIGPDNLNTPANQAANLDTVHQSMVLLKNINNTLPLAKSGYRKVAIIGPNAENGVGQLSNYYGIPSSIVTIAQGLSAVLQPTGAAITVAPGCANVACASTANISAAVSAAQDADLVFLVVGLDDSVEGEQHDRVALPCNGVLSNAYGLPGCQYQLVTEVTEATSATVVMILMHGGGVETSGELANDRIGAILDVFYPGPLGGTGIADTVFGDYNPGGRMPITIYDPSVTLPSLSDYNMNDGVGFTYRYYKSKVLIPFGFGLSYTTFAYNNLQISANQIAACGSLTVTATVSNTGARVGDEVAQLYVAAPRTNATFPVPFRSLQGYNRTTLSPGQDVELTFTLDAWSMSVTDNAGDRLILPGTYTLWLGGHQPVNLANASQSDSTGLLTATFTVDASEPVYAKYCANLPRPCYGCF